MRKPLSTMVFLLALAALLAAQSAVITKPKANDLWLAGSSQNIDWTFTGTATVKLLLIDAAGVKVGPIKSGLALSAGSWAWTVGSLENGKTAGPGKGYTIQMVRTDGGVPVVLCKSAGPFEIYTAQVIPPAPPPGNPPPPPPSPGSPAFPRLVQRERIAVDKMTPMLRVTKPVDGTQVIPPTTCPINWTLPGGTYPEVKIFYYPVGHGEAWGLSQAVWITQGTPNDGFFDWQLDGGERTGKFVVRVMTPDGKIKGESGVVSIAAAPLPPGRHARVVAPSPEQMLAKSASLDVKDLYFYYKGCGLELVTVKVKINAVPSDGQKDFVLSPDVGHPQFGSLFLRCQVLDPLFPNNGPLVVDKAYDRWVSLKGGGGSEKIRDVYPKTVPGGESQVAIVFEMKPPLPLGGKLVLQKMPRDLFGGGNYCRQFYFPKIIVSLHLITKSGDVMSELTQYFLYSESECPLFKIIPAGEVNGCQEGVQDW